MLGLVLTINRPRGIGALRIASITGIDNWEAIDMTTSPYAMNELHHDADGALPRQNKLLTQANCEAFWKRSCRII